MIAQEEEELCKEYLTEKLLFNEQKQNKHSKLYPASHKKGQRTNLSFLSTVQTPYGQHIVQV